MENELLILIYGYFSKSLEQLNILGPMVFLLFGILLSPLGLDIIEISLNSEGDK